MTPTKHLDLDAIENALSERSGGIVFSHPCCPTGVLYSNSEIQELANLLKWGEKRFRRPLFLISDEVHRHVNWSRSEFNSPLVDYPRSLSIYSFGKVLLMQGQRIGYVAVSPLMPDREHVQRMLERAARMMGFCTPTTLMQRAICRLVDYKPPLESIASKQLEIRTALKAYGYDVCDAEATFFVYVKSPLPDDIQFVERLAREGVLVLPSMLFHEKGYFRISATARAEAVRRGLPIFERMLV
jgi:aspartate aminotransferase